LIEEHGLFEIEQQTKERNLLHALALTGYSDVRNCALDIAFRYGESCRDIIDAFKPYSESPFAVPPAKYLDDFLRVDWSKFYKRLEEIFETQRFMRRPVSMSCRLSMRSQR